MTKSLLITLFLVVWFLPMTTTAVEYIMTDQAAEAMRLSLSLKNKTASRLLEEEWNKDPENYLLLYLMQFNDAISLTILDNEVLYEQFRADYEKKREIMDEAGEDSPYYRWLEGEMLFQVGLAQIKFGTKISGAAKVYNAYQIIKKNEELYPGFWLDDRLMATFEMAFANIPPVIRWAASMIGIRGNMDRGFDRLRSYHQKAMGQNGLAEESIVYMTLAYKMRWEEGKGLEFMKGLDEEYYRTTLVGFFYANLALFSGMNDISIQVLEKLEREKTEIPFYAMDYLIGRCYLNKLDHRAGPYLLGYIDNAPVLDYKKDACNRLSWYYLVRDETSKYEEYHAMVDSIGNDLRDRDREAAAESRAGYRPHPELLKARLLFDGGYNERSWEHMALLNEEDLSFLPYALEYHYRKGRLYYRDKEFGKSISEMIWVIDHGSEEPYTFATRAALHLGNVYEDLGNKEKAIEYYELCIDLYDSDHSAEGIENKAEMAIKTLDVRR